MRNVVLRQILACITTKISTRPSKIGHFHPHMWPSQGHQYFLRKACPRLERGRESITIALGSHLRGSDGWVYWSFAMFSLDATTPICPEMTRKRAAYRRRQTAISRKIAISLCARRHPVFLAVSRNHGGLPSSYRPLLDLSGLRLYLELREAWSGNRPVTAQGSLGLF